MTAHPTIIRRSEVEARTGLSRSSIYARLKRNPKRPGDFDPSFPRPIRIGKRSASGAVGWIAAEVDQWVASRAAERDWTPPAAPEPEPAPPERRTRRPQLGRPKAVPILDDGA